MIGALSGDIIGSVYEFNNIKTTEFSLFRGDNFFTDDSVLTVALADSILTGDAYEVLLKEYFLQYPNAGYGGTFRKWALGLIKGPYNSYGNGAAMRISPVAWSFNSLKEVLEGAVKYTKVTHNSEEGIAGAQATASAIFLARSGKEKEYIKEFIEKSFKYNLSRTCDQIRPDYSYDVTCQGTVPQAITAFIESTDFESALRLAVSLGGDTDTLACITGSIAEAYYGGVPKHIFNQTIKHLDKHLADITHKYLDKFVPLYKRFE